MSTSSIRNIIIVIAACNLFRFQSIYEDRETIDPSSQITYTLEVQAMLSEQETWQAFRTINGDGWDIVWDEQTLVPRIIYGGAIPMIGGLDHHTLEASSNDFLESLESLTLVNVENFELDDIREREDRWIIRYTQNYLGLNIEGSELSFLINPFGKLVRLRASVFPVTNIQTQAQISIAEALLRAQQEFGYIVETDNLNSMELIIYPVREEGGMLYFLTYKIDLTDGENHQNWVYYIDAIDGTIIAAFDNTTSADMEGTVTGYIYPEYPTDSKVVEQWEDGWVSVNTTTDATDVSGDYSIYVGSVGQYTVNANLEGEHLEVIDDDGADLTHSGTGYTWMSHDWTWNSSGSYSAASDDEVNAWYHITLMYELVKSSPFNHDMMTQDYFEDYLEDKLKVYVRSNSTINGLFRPEYGTITMGEGTSQNTNPALDSDILYHEMGHAIHCSMIGHTSYTYGGGYFPSLKEGTSDYWACTINNDSEVFEVIKPSAVRDLDNDWVWGDGNCSGQQSHCFGQYLGGGLWDMRSTLGATIADKLFFEALFEEARTFSDYLDDILISDDIYYGDGNGTVTISTPHLDDILHSFGGHGIYPATASMPPAKPINVVLTDIGIETRISWEGLNENSDFDYFQVYRKTTPDIGGGPKPLWSSIGTTTGLYFDDDEFELDPNGTVRAEYRVRTKDDTGNYSNYSNVASSDGYGVTSKSPPRMIEFEKSTIESLPLDLTLGRNYPNPFNPSTSISYGLHEASKVELKIFDLRGKVVLVLESSFHSAGWYQTTWNGTDKYGQSAPAGIYIYHLTTESAQKTKKMLLVK
ncbi:MAG: T9SS type A sorting domain-containing protein [FCB group bacterium]|nr:T9SS type A sorting domain-containing protein [FCB group bacterium]